MDGARRKRIVELIALGVVVIGLSVFGAFAVVRHYDLANPYRDGTTHNVVLTFDENALGSSACLEDWTVALGSYSWHVNTTPPWGQKSVEGTLHIIDSHLVAEGWPGHSFSVATFTAQGRTIEMTGRKWGKGPRYSDWGCSIPLAGPER